MLSLFVMLKSFWMVFLDHKMELFCVFSLTEGTEVVANSIEDGVWEDKYERTCALNDGFEI